MKINNAEDLLNSVREIIDTNSWEAREAGVDVIAVSKVPAASGSPAIKIALGVTAPRLWLFNEVTGRLEGRGLKLDKIHAGDGLESKLGAFKDRYDACTSGNPELFPPTFLADAAYKMPNEHVFIGSLIVDSTSRMVAAMDSRERTTYLASILYAFSRLYIMNGFGACWNLNHLMHEFHGTRRGVKEGNGKITSQKGINKAIMHFMQVVKEFNRIMMPNFELLVNTIDELCKNESEINEAANVGLGGFYLIERFKEMLQIATIANFGFPSPSRIYNAVVVEKQHDYLALLVMLKLGRKKLFRSYLQKFSRLQPAVLERRIARALKLDVTGEPRLPAIVDMGIKAFPAARFLFTNRDYDGYASARRLLEMPEPAGEAGFQITGVATTFVLSPSNFELGNDFDVLTYLRENGGQHYLQIAQRRGRGGKVRVTSIGRHVASTLFMHEHGLNNELDLEMVRDEKTGTFSVDLLLHPSRELLRFWVLETMNATHACITTLEECTKRGACKIIFHVDGTVDFRVTRGVENLLRRCTRKLKRG
jgi:hypothetical protein